MFRDDIVKGDHRGTRVGGRSEIQLRGFCKADKTRGSFPRRSGNMLRHRWKIVARCEFCGVVVMGARLDASRVSQAPRMPELNVRAMLQLKHEQKALIGKGNKENSQGEA